MSSSDERVEITQLRACWSSSRPSRCRC